MTRIDPATTGEEPTLLSGFLDYLRETIAEKTDGPDAAGLAATHPGDGLDRLSATLWARRAAPQSHRRHRRRMTVDGTRGAMCDE
ncbi:MAG: hypothetical protein M3Z00_00425 [Actinomycetota bacterium]|nr:hypothetical protein [Actinomycetota bacterium]